MKNPFEPVASGVIDVDVPDDVLERLRARADMRVVASPKERTATYRSIPERTLVLASTDGELERLRFSLDGKRLEFDVVLGRARRTMVGYLTTMVVAIVLVVILLHLSLAADLMYSLGVFLLFGSMAWGELLDAKRRAKRRVEEVVIDELATLYKEGRVRVASAEPTVQLEEDDAVARNRAER